MGSRPGAGSGADTWHCVRGSLPADAAGEQRHTFFDLGVATGPRAVQYLFEGEGERAWSSVDFGVWTRPGIPAGEATLSLFPAGKPLPDSIHPVP